MKQTVEMVRKMGRYNVGDRYESDSEWCRRLIAIGWARALPEHVPLEPEPKRRHRRRSNGTTEAA